MGLNLFAGSRKGEPFFTTFASLTARGEIEVRFSEIDAPSSDFMTQEEYAIVMFLQGAPETFYTRKEIARKAVHRRVYEENPHWVDVPLAALVARGTVEQNDNAQYRWNRSAS